MISILLSIVGGFLIGYYMLYLFFKLHPFYSTAEQFSYSLLSVVIFIFSHTLIPLVLAGHLNKWFLIWLILVWVTYTADIIMAHIVKKQYDKEYGKQEKPNHDEF